MVRRADDAEGPAERRWTSAASASPARSISRRSRAAPACAAIKALEYSFHEAGIMLRLSGDTIELTPPFIISEAQIGEVVDKVGRTIEAVA